MRLGLRLTGGNLNAICLDCWLIRKRYSENIPIATNIQRLPPESRSFRLFYGTDYPSLKLNTWSRFTHPFDIDLMCLHSAELNVVAVTENVNTFLLVWTHVSRCSVNWLYFFQVYKVLTVVIYSSQLSNYQLLFLYLTLFIYHWFFTLNPTGLCDRIGWGIRSQLFWFLLGLWVFVSGSAGE